MLAAIGAVGYYFISQKTSPAPVVTENSQDINNEEMPSSERQNKISKPSTETIKTDQAVTTSSYANVLKTYKNSKFGFEVNYPSSLKVEEGKIEPNTYFVVWKNPNYDNAKVNIIYINEGKAALTSAELSNGIQEKIGTKSGYKFTSEANPLYWVDAGDYALAIYFEKPTNAGSVYNEYLDISSFKF